MGELGHIVLQTQGIHEAVPPVAHVADVPDPVRFRDVHPVEVAVDGRPVPAQAGEDAVGREAHLPQDGAEEAVHLEAVAAPAAGDHLVEQVLGLQGDGFIVVHIQVLKGDMGDIGPVEAIKPLRIRAALGIADPLEQRLQIHRFRSFFFSELIQYRISFPFPFVNPQAACIPVYFSDFGA